MLRFVRLARPVHVRVCVAVVLAVALTLAIVIRPALADPPKAFTEQRKTGRELEASGKHAEAAAAFGAALRAVPDDPSVLAELGWVQFELKDLKKAEASTRAALAGMLKTSPADEDGMPVITPTRMLRGEVLYNLGRILEASGDKPSAVKAYRDAHTAYPRAAVREQLAKLDAAAAAELEPYRPEKMTGPFASIKAYCESIAKDSKTGDCRCDAPLKNEGGGKLAAPFTQVAVFASRGCSEDQQVALAVEFAAGWFVATATPMEWNNSLDHCSAARWHFKGATLARSTLRIDYTTTGSCETKGSSWGWDEHSTIAIGVGPSGAPSATSPIALTWDMLPEHTHQIRATLTWSDGAVDVAGKFAEKPDALNFAGKHALVFP
jgi:hypothetical protein